MPKPTLFHPVKNRSCVLDYWDSGRLPTELTSPRAGPKPSQNRLDPRASQNRLDPRAVPGPSQNRLDPRAGPGSSPNRLDSVREARGRLERGDDTQAQSKDRVARIKLAAAAERLGLELPYTR